MVDAESGRISDYRFLAAGLIFIVIMLIPAFALRIEEFTGPITEGSFLKGGRITDLSGVICPALLNPAGTGDRSLNIKWRFQ